MFLYRILIDKYHSSVRDPSLLLVQIFKVHRLDRCNKCSISSKVLINDSLKTYLIFVWIIGLMSLFLVLHQGQHNACRITVLKFYWNGQLVWTPALALYLCVDRGPGTVSSGIYRPPQVIPAYPPGGDTRFFFICSRFPRGHYLLWLVRFSLV